jgi:hypothetical protein
MVISHTGSAPVPPNTNCKLTRFAVMSVVSNLIVRTFKLVLYYKSHNYLAIRGFSFWCVVLQLSVARRYSVEWWKVDEMILREAVLV